MKNVIVTLLFLVFTLVELSAQNIPPQSSIGLTIGATWLSRVDAGYVGGGSFNPKAGTSLGLEGCYFTESQFQVYGGVRLNQFRFSVSPDPGLFEPGMLPSDGPTYRRTNFQIFAGSRLYTQPATWRFYSGLELGYSANLRERPGRNDDPPHAMVGLAPGLWWNPGSHPWSLFFQPALRAMLHIKKSGRNYLAPAIEIGVRRGW